MKLNISFVPFSGEDKEFKFVSYGEKDALFNVCKALQMYAFCTNVYLTEDKKEEN